MRLAAATLFTSANIPKARARAKAKARTTTRANAGPNATGTLTTIQLPCHHLPRRLQHHRPNTLVSPRTPARPSQPNTTPQNPTDTAGSTGGFFPIPAPNAREFSNLTTRHVSTLLLQPVPTPLVTLTSNLRTNHGEFEKTRKTTHNVFHLPSHINYLPCHTRGCWSHNNLLLPSLPGTTTRNNNNHYFHRHNRG